LLLRLVLKALLEKKKKKTRKGKRTRRRKMMVRRILRIKTESWRRAECV